jgi:hypothetical protein
LVEELIKKLDYMAITNKAGANQIAGLISGDVANLTRTDATNLTKDGGLTQEDLSQYAIDLGYASDSEMAIALGYTSENGGADTLGLLFDWRELANSIYEGFQQAELKAYKQGLNQELGLLNKDFLANATLGQYETYANLLTKMLGIGGEELAVSFGNNFSKVIEAADTEDQKLKILEMLGSFDFTKESDITSFFDYLREIGVGLDTDVI